MADATLTIRIDADLKSAAEKAAKAENRTLTDFVLEALQRRLVAHCGHCGRSDQPVVGAGLSAAFDAFLASKPRGLVTITVAGTPEKAYSVKLVLNEQSEGFLLAAVEFRQGDSPFSASMPIPRGLITGWQDDSFGSRYDVLLSLGYLSGNDAAIRAFLRRNPCGIATLRAVIEIICEHPDIAASDVQVWLGRQAGGGSAIKALMNAGLVRESASGRLRTTQADADAQLRMARAMRLDLDAAFY